MLISGKTVSSGHYIATIKWEDDWWLMNDEEVSRTDINEALKSTKNYILFFKSDP